jgi:hypothetical protein
MDSGPDNQKKEGKKGLLLRLGWGKAREPALFKPDEIDIFTNRKTHEAWIFHSPPLSIEISEVVYDHKSKRMTFVSKEGKRYDLGVKIQSLIRPTIEKIDHIVVTQITDGLPISWFSAPVRHTNTKEDEDGNPEE